MVITTHIVRWWRDPDTRVRLLFAAAISGAGLAAWWGGRSGGPWCSPESLLQWHAVWHAAAAVALTMVLRAGHPTR